MDKKKDILESLIQAIGWTPLVRLRRIPREEGLKGEVLVKVEYFNPTGSLKDRIYLEMISEAVKDGELRPGMEIIEASTGNAGISCAFIGGFYGHKVTVVMPEGMSRERRETIRMYGGRVLLTPGGESDVDLCLDVVKRKLLEEPERYWWPNQYANLNNPGAHYKGTGPELWMQSKGGVDCFVAAQGTGGTITGVGRYLRERRKDIPIYAVEPAEAPILTRGSWGSHRIEGIGDGFIPENLDLNLLTGVVTVSSDEAVEMARRLAVEEGIFCGISSGCNVAAALKIAEAHPELEAIATMINDTGNRYFTTELCGTIKEIKIPERSHATDEETIKKLERYWGRWEVIP
ncbi:MAG: cysteine synthase family protein [Candidatus Bathyarchaeia archaeon]|nr:cysteine synthase family protein [Candidatus Bathyarchaeota archaeon]